MTAIKKIGIIGCGTIGQKVAVELDKGSVPGASLKAMSSRNLEKVRVFAGTLGSPPAVVELKDLVAGETNFQVASQRVDFYGWCSGCATRRAC